MGKNAKPGPAPQARLIKHESNIRKAETQAHKKTSTATLKGGQEVLSSVLPAPPRIFYGGGMRQYIDFVVDKCGSIKEAAERLDLSTSFLYQLRNSKANAGPKTCRGINEATGFEVKIRKQFFIKGAVNEDE